MMVCQDFVALILQCCFRIYLLGLKNMKGKETLVMEQQLGYSSANSWFITVLNSRYFMCDMAITSFGTI